MPPHNPATWPSGDMQPPTASPSRSTRTEVRTLQHMRSILSAIDVAWEDAQPIIKDNYPSIRWNMNPPRTPSFGGHYESLIKTIKNAFKTLIKWPKHCLDDEELATSLKEAAAIANMRPLTDLSEDPQDLPPIRPSDFLNAPVLGCVPDWTEAAITHSVKTEVEKVRQALWQRMRDEVLKNYHKLKQGQQGERLEPGDLVLLKGRDWRPDHWPLARVVEVRPGIDKETRVVKVRHLFKGENGSQVKETLQSTRNIYRLQLPEPASSKRLLNKTIV